MDRPRQVAQRHPLLLAIGAVLGALVAMAAAVAVVAAVSGWVVSDPEAQMVGQLAGTLLVLGVLRRLGWLGAAGVTESGTRSVWLVTSVVLVVNSGAALAAFFGTIDVDLSTDVATVPVLAHTVLAGVMEELLFRGLVLHVLVVGWADRRRGDAAAIVVSALLFGLLHFLNVASGSPDVTALQALEAFLSAILYGALVLVGGSVWPAVALHALRNLVVNVVAENVAAFEVTVADYATLVLWELPVLALAVAFLVAHRSRTADQPHRRLPA